MGLTYDIFNDTLTLEPKSASSATQVIRSFDCNSTLVVGDHVYEDVAGHVLKLADNTSIIPALGVVISKPSSLRCRVLILGARSGYTGLLAGKAVYLSVTGGVTQDPDSLNPGYQQTLGVAAGTDTVFYMPNANRTYLP